MEHNNRSSSPSGNHRPAAQFKDGTWWQRRTSMERRLSICTFVMVCISIGLAAGMITILFRVQIFGNFLNKSNKDNVLTPLERKVDVDSERFTMLSPPIEPVPLSTESTSGDDEAAGHQSPRAPIKPIKQQDQICKTPGCVIAAAELLQNMDQTVDPCEDFYSFACGSFEKNTIIPDDKSSVTTFSLLNDELTKQLRIMVERPIEEEEAEPFKLVKKLYQSCLNKTRAEEKGTEPLLEILDEFGGWPVIVGDSWDESNFLWSEMIYKLRRMGFSSDLFIDFSVTTDLKNSTLRTIDLDQASLGMPGREYLIKGLEDKDVQAYLDFQINLAVLLGADPNAAREEQSEAVQFEIDLAFITLPMEERRDPTLLYNPMTVKELSDLVPDIPWLEYMNNIAAPYQVLTEKERVIVNVPDYFKNLTELLANTPPRTIANYMMWRVAGSSVSYLNEAARNLQLKYSTVLSGTTERKPRWEECTDLVSGSLGNAVGAMYVREHFKESARQAVNEMVQDLRTVFNEIIDELDWMDNKTRGRAKEKAAAMTTHIAYPDELLDDNKLIDLYDNLNMDATDYLRNALNLTIFGMGYGLKKLREPVNKTDWVSHGRPAVVNAYYSPLENSIQFPAGILQGAFFGKDRPMYLNYAAIGWVIGHEITHGFDDQGRQFGPDGNLAEWWDSETKTQYLERAQCIINQYGNYSIPELDLNVNGINTQGENIADNGGIKEAYRAYIRWATRQESEENWDLVEPRLPGLQKYTVRQLFWIGAGSIWCQKSRPESLKLSILTGQHSPSLFRVRGPIANMPQFASDFGCRRNRPMNPSKKCAVW